MTTKQFKLPDLGEGLTEGEILQWLVAEGDTITLNQPIVEVETAKAAVEVPSPYAGVVAKIHHQAGETVDVGSPIISVRTDAEGEGDEPAAGGSAPADQSAPSAAAVAERPADTEFVPKGLVPDDDGAEPEIGAGLIGGAAPGGRTAILVGYGPKSVTAVRRPRKPGAGSAPSGPAGAGPGQVTGDEVPVPPEPGPGRHPVRHGGLEVGRSAAQRLAHGPVLAKPPVRKLAKDLGVDLARLTGTGPQGTITRADVHDAARTTGEAAPATSAPATAAPATSAPAARTEAAFDASRERRIPVKGVRKMTAEAMVRSAFTAPHVTEFVTLDVTPMMDLVGRLKALPDFADVKLTPMLLVAKALLLAVRRNPEINATWDDDAQEIVVKEYVNLGIAAATPRGLIVPNVKDAGRLSLLELARELQALTETAKAGRTPPADMAQGTITITNVGVFGVDNGTPIINPGESAILCFGAVRDMPWVHEGEICVRKVTQLALSFDHRNVDGALGSQFLADVGRVLSDPTALIAWG